MWHQTSKAGTMKCAFCKNWYDPANAHIRPVNLHLGQWEYEVGAKSQCAARCGTFKAEQPKCSKFENKIFE